MLRGSVKLGNQVAMTALVSFNFLDSILLKSVDCSGIVGSHFFSAKKKVARKLGLLVFAVSHSSSEAALEVSTASVIP